MNLVVLRKIQKQHKVVAQQISIQEKVDIFDDVIDFIYNNPHPRDEDVHDWAEERGIDKTVVEEVIYSLATAFVDILTSGKAIEKGISEQDVDADELEKGIEVELEHTSNELVAKKIALDHLAEIADYYTQLKAMEDSAKKE